jgi:hypothetical protein
MQWHNATILPGSDIARVVATPEDEFFAVTTTGILNRAKSLAADWEVVAEFGGRVYDLAYVPESGGVVSVGAKGAVSWWDGRAVARDRVPASSTLRALVKLSSSDWLIAGEDNPVTGVIFTGNRGSWHQLHLEGLKAGLRVAAVGDPGSCILAGERGFAARYGGDQLVRLATNTRHPLRAIAVTSSGVYIGGGGWAEEMPALLRFEDGSVTELVRAGGDRVITGLCGLKGDIWLTDNHAQAGVWTGGVGRLSGTASEPVAEFGGRRLFGIAQVGGGALIVWGSNGLFASSVLG